MKRSFILIAISCFVAANGAGLVDNPIVGSSTTYLDGKWKLSSGSVTIDAQVPGDLLTDLQTANLIGDPLYELNFLNATEWNKDWDYTTTFSLSEADATSTSLLVFDGIKMGASISVDGNQIGTADDQFLRYVFPLAGMSAGKHTLQVSFKESIDCGGRWMSCTGGWVSEFRRVFSTWSYVLNFSELNHQDWAPYTTTEQGGAATFSKGIWKNVYITTVEAAAIVHVVPQIFYTGAYPATPLKDGSFSDFNVSVRLHFWSKSGSSGTVNFAVPWASDDAQTSVAVTIPAGESKQTFTLAAASAKNVKLWWPAGVGQQPLYNITVSFTASTTAAAATAISTTRRVGFRHFALVTGNDTDPTYVTKNAGAEGSDTLGMIWKVNGAAVMSKGANQIPMEELEGRMRADAHRVMVQSAVDANMNTLRVWGGGMFLPDAWYDACDELGVMIYHDMQYAQRGAQI
jgi:beta-galactosidase/beta-glucuronidase